jgi:hypothetical protein
VFIVILGGASLDALQDYYHRQFGVARAPVMPSVVSVISARYGLPRDYKHPIAALQVSGKCYIEADQMPAQVAPRPCDPGQLPPGIAMVTFEVEGLPGDLPSALGPAVAARGLPYDGRTVRTCVGATGELIELIEAG